jgi:hypothetical protein
MHFHQFAYFNTPIAASVAGGNPVTSGRILEVNNTAASYPGTGTVWYDVSGNGYDMSTVNSPTWTTTDGWSLNGSSQYLTGSAALTTGLNTTYFNSSSPVRNGITIFVDCYKNSNGSEGTLVGGWTASLLKVLFEINSNQTVETAVNQTTSGVTGANTTGAITTAARSIMGMVVDSSGTKTVYRNNSALAGTQNVPANNWASDNPFWRFGAREFPAGTPYGYFAGKIKAIVMYNRALNSTELTSVYNYLNAL